MYYSVRKGLSTLAVAAACSNFSVSEGCEFKNCITLNTTNRSVVCQYSKACNINKDFNDQTFSMVDSSIAAKVAAAFSKAATASWIYLAARPLINWLLGRMGLMPKSSIRNETMRCKPSQCLQNSLVGLGVTAVSAIGYINWNGSTFLANLPVIGLGVAQVGCDIYTIVRRFISKYRLEDDVVYLNKLNNDIDHSQQAIAFEKIETYRDMLDCVDNRLLDLNFDLKEVVEDGFPINELVERGINIIDLYNTGMVSFRDLYRAGVRSYTVAAIGDNNNILKNRLIRKLQILEHQHN